MVVNQVDGTAPVLTEAGVLEVILQEQLKAHPELVPIEEFGLAGPLMVVGRETPLPSGSADLVALSRQGDVVMVEFKTGPQNPDFRHALAQLLDYGGDLWTMTFATFDQAVAVRYFQSLHCPADSPTKNATGLLAAAAATWPGIDGAELEQFTDRLTNALRRGAFHYVVAAQRFVPAMQATVDYLNSAMSDSSFYLVELVCFEGDGVSVYEARTVTKPAKQTATKGSTPTTSEHDFLASVIDDDYREALRQLLDFCRELGLRFGWGTKGTSIRLLTPYKAEPISIAWLFPSGGIGWMGLSDLTLGHDASTVSKVAELAKPMANYVAEVSTIPHGVPAKPASINGSTFTASAVASQLTVIEGVISHLVEQFTAL